MSLTKNFAQRKFNLRLIKIIKINLTPFVVRDAYAGVLEFIQQLSSSKCLKSNPNCIVDVEVLPNNVDPSVQVEFVDGRTINWKNANCAGW